MARIKIDLPDSFSFSTAIVIRITDINYGGHVGNDAILSLIHEARLQYLQQLGYSEMDFAGVGLIMADAAIEFRSELFYGDTVIISVTSADFSKVSFDLFYKLEKSVGENGEEKRIVVAAAKTGMVCYNYAAKRVAAVPEEARRNMQ
jgi:acyl-CoA thioester hydrolase